MKIYVCHRQDWGLDEARVVRLAKGVVKKLAVEYQGDLGLVFIGKKKARELNWRYRQKDYIPQVLSFPSGIDGADVDGVRRLGEVVICGEKLKYESRYRQKNVYEILEEWLEHGIGNLC